MTRIAIHGAGGRMGQRLVALAGADPNLSVVAAIDNAAHPRLGEDAGMIAGVDEIGVPLSSELEAEADVVIDFSTPSSAQRIAETCRDRNIPLVMATTGLSDSQQAAVRGAAETIAVLWAPNMSMAVNLLMKLSEIAAESLRDAPSGADVEIIERHHRYKEDSPSGTALEFGRIIAEKMGHTVHRHGREGQVGARPHNEIAYHAVRAGDDPGQHTIIFGLLGETIELVVRATNRDCYAHGALAAAKFLPGKPPGVYNMADVLGL